MIEGAGGPTPQRSGPPEFLDPDVPRLAFGPYAGERLDHVAVIDPAYLRDLVGEGIGPADFRAEAARALLARGRFDPAVGRLSGPNGQGQGLSYGGRTEGLAGPGRAEVSRPAGLGPALAHWRGSTRAWKAVLATAFVAAVAVIWAGRDDPGRAGDSGGAGGRAPAAVGANRPAGTAGAAGGARDGSGTSDGSGVSAPGAVATDLGAGGTGAAALATPGTPAVAGAGPDEAVARDVPAAPCGARVAGAIPAEAAADFLDTFQAVEFEVVKTRDTGKVTFLNSHDPYQGHFYVAIFPTDYDRYPEHPALHFRGKCIVVQGTVELYRGTPQLVLRGPEDVRIVDSVELPGE